MFQNCRHISGKSSEPVPLPFKRGEQTKLNRILFLKQPVFELNGGSGNGETFNTFERASKVL